MLPFVSPVTSTGLVADPAEAHEVPPSIEYSVPVIAAPPLEPAVKATLSEPETPPAVTEVMVGADGGADGVPVTIALATPEPLAFTPRITTWYVVPFERLLMVSGLVVAAGFGVVHEVPLSREYS